MSFQEFLEIYVNSTDEVRAQIAETLDSLRTLPVSQATTLHIDATTHEPYQSVHR